MSLIGWFVAVYRRSVLAEMTNLGHSFITRLGLTLPAINGYAPIQYSKTLHYDFTIPRITFRLITKIVIHGLV